MKNLILNKSFFIGFVGGIIAFFIFTLIYAKERNPQPCHHCRFEFGFPLVFYQSFFMGEEKLLLSNLFVDLLCGLIISILTGIGISWLINRKTDTQFIKF